MDAEKENDLINFLESVSHFSSLNREKLSRLLKVCKHEEFKKGEVIFREGEKAEKLYIVQEGFFEVWKNHGKPGSNLLASSGIGSIIGEMALIDDLPRSATVVAREPLKLLSVTRDDFHEILGNRDTIANSLLKGLSAVVRSSNDSYVRNLIERNIELEKTNKELEDYKNRLEDMVVERTAELQTKNDELRRLDDQRVRLLGAASHDLKSPLGAVELKLDLLTGGYIGELNKEQCLEIDKIKKRLTSLRYFINDMLDLTAMELRGQPGPETKPVDVAEQIRETIAELEEMAAGNGLSIKHHIPHKPVMVMSQGKRLSSVWWNLISNAIKYGQGGETVEIGWRVHESTVSITVTDHGIGILKEDLSRLFSDFFRAKNARDKNIPGTGLGLSITKRIIEAGGGSITASSEAGQGTQFTVTLPLA